MACTGESPRGSQPRGSDETAAGPGSSSSGSAPAAASTPGVSSFAGDVSSIQNAMEAAVRGKVVPGIVVWVRRGRQVRILARGRADVAVSVPMTPRHRFRIGSITKPMVAVVVLKLVERRVLSLHDTVEQWLPGLVTTGRDITIEELLNHSSGLADYVDSPRFLPLLDGPPVTPRQLVRLATAEPELFSPGQGTSYTDTGYLLLGMIIEQATHRQLASTLRSTVFARAGMTTSSLAPDGATTRPVAHGYEKGHDVTTPQLTWAWAAGAVVSDAADLAVFFDRFGVRTTAWHGPSRPDARPQRHPDARGRIQPLWLGSRRTRDTVVDRQVVVFVNATSDDLAETFQSSIPPCAGRSDARSRVRSSAWSGC